MADADTHLAAYEDGVRAGTLNTRQEEHDRRLKSIETKMDEQGVKLDKLVESMTLARGGYRALVSVGLIAATVSGAVTGIVHWISAK